MKVPALLFLLLAPFLAYPQLSKRDSLWMATHYTKMERMIPMRDGIRLFTSIYVPKDVSEKHPILLMRTPYSCAPYGENRFTGRYADRRDSLYFQLHYIIVYQDVRGRFMSEGEFEDIRPFLPDKKGKREIDEASDTYDTIDWLLQNISNHNGKVGCHGISYPGFYATLAAASAHPNLVAVSPQAPVTDWFIGDDFHHNGVVFLMDAFGFYRSFGIPRPKPLMNYPPPTALTIADQYQFFLQNGTFRELKEKYFGDSIKFWNDLQAHPDYDDWWKARDARSATHRLKPAMLITGGLFDAEDCWGGWNLYKAIEKQSPGIENKVVYGPWFHGGWKRSDGSRLGNIWFEGNTADYYCFEIELPFFEYYLRGKGDPDRIREATVFMTGENNWKTFDQWPPATVQTAPLYLGAGGSLSFSKSSAGNGYDEYISDPWKPIPYSEDVFGGRHREYMSEDQRFASMRPDVLVYRSEVLTEDVTLAGPVLADLFVSLSTTDADWVVKLIDVFPDTFKYPPAANIRYDMGGYQMLVRGEIMRGRYRNSFEKPEAFVPGQITQVKFELPDVAHTFQKGHRIMIQIQSTWYPLADRNPQQFVDPYQCSSEDLVKSTIRVHHGASHPSSVVLPLLK